MVNGLHLYSTIIQSAVLFMPLIHPFTHTFTHQQQQLAAMQGTNQLIRSNWGLGVLLRDTSTRPGWDRTGNPLTASRQLLPPEPYRPTHYNSGMQKSISDHTTRQISKWIGYSSRRPISIKNKSNKYLIKCSMRVYFMHFTVCFPEENLDHVFEQHITFGYNDPHARTF